MTDCHFVQDEPPVNSSTKFNSAQINTVGIETGLMKHIWLCLSHSVFIFFSSRSYFHTYCALFDIIIFAHLEMIAENKYCL